VYPIEKVKTILTSLGFEILKETAEGLDLAVPYHKPDISIPADIVEEVVRIDGLDNIAIPSVISMSPAIDPLEKKEKFKDKIANYLVGRGFTEILTNSITNSAYFSEEVLASSVKMLNNLSADLDVMRPSMLETGLETIAYNINRKNTSIAFFEMGKVYGKSASAKYYESEQLAIYISGKQQQDGWRTKTMPADFFVAKGIATALCKLLGLAAGQWKSEDGGQVTYIIHKKVVCTLDIIGAKKLQTFGIKQSVLYIQFDLSNLLALYQSHQVVYQEVSKYPSVERDIALVLPQATKYAAIEQSIAAVKIAALQESSVFDIFESEKLGDQKKSVAINFVFNAVDKTLTDVEIDAMMKKLVQEFEKNLQAEIRK
jgi:phenylalanyl-tRNA synthetase beta chain